MKTILLTLGCIALIYALWRFVKAIWSASSDVPSAKNDWLSDRKQPGSGYDSGDGNYPESHGGEH